MKRESQVKCLKNVSKRNEKCKQLLIHSQVPKYLNLVNKGGGSQGLERALGHLLRIMAKAQVFDFQCFLLMDGLGIITAAVINPGMQEDAEVSKKYVITFIRKVC